jgi:hypothetical protein
MYPQCQKINLLIQLLRFLFVAAITITSVAQLTVTCFTGGPSGDCVDFAPTFCSSLTSLSVSGHVEMLRLTLIYSF